VDDEPFHVDERTPGAASDIGELLARDRFACSVQPWDE
jgi:hypothetical protein